MNRYRKRPNLIPNPGFLHRQNDPEMRAPSGCDSASRAACPGRLARRVTQLAMDIQSRWMPSGLGLKRLDKLQPGEKAAIQRPKWSGFSPSKCQLQGRREILLAMLLEPLGFSYIGDCLTRKNGPKETSGRFHLLLLLSTSYELHNLQRMISPSGWGSNRYQKKPRTYLSFC